MSKRSSDLLFQLIRSLEKAEKRHFKLYIKRSSSNENLKIVQLFDALDAAEEYDEIRLLKKTPDIRKAQLSNLKAHLYKQILASLRLLKSTDSIDLQLNEQFDYAHILYKKGLVLQSLRLLEKAKEMAKANQKFTFLMQAIALEKRIESLHITRSMQDRAERLSEEALEVSGHIDMVTRLSNVALRLYSWYIKNGHIRNAEEEAGVKKFLSDNLPYNALEQQGFYERLYLYQSYAWYAFIRQDFLMYYRYTQKWVWLFDNDTMMKRVETSHYIKGLHSLLNAHFILRNHAGLGASIAELESFSQSERVLHNDNFRVQSILYIAQAKINRHFLSGTFRDGLSLVPEIEKQLRENAVLIDPHRAMVLNYKMAVLYFGSGDYNSCIDYLHPIINTDGGLRYDLQCYARLLHLLAHFELGNFELVAYLAKSVYRFMAKMKNLTHMEDEILKFLRHSFFVSRFKLKEDLARHLETIKQFENNRYQTRVFVHLDLISWLESKVGTMSISALVKEKYGGGARHRNKPKKRV